MATSFLILTVPRAWMLFDHETVLPCSGSPNALQFCGEYCTEGFAIVPIQNGVVLGSDVQINIDCKSRVCSYRKCCGPAALRAQNIVVTDPLYLYIARRSMKKIFVSSFFVWHGPCYLNDLLCVTSGGIKSCLIEYIGVGWVPMQS